MDLDAIPGLILAASLCFIYGREGQYLHHLRSYFAYETGQFFENCCCWQGAA